jgi:glycosyltransferase involved in cell wall biosynthesis
VSQALTWICAVIVVYWLLVTSRVLGVQRRVPWLRPVPRPPGATPLSVVIPARNEERDLAMSLRTVLVQQGVDLEVVVVDDHSTDATGRIADAIAREDARVRVIHDPELPAGWLGKTNAMCQGAAATTRPLLLFSDGDVRHAPTSFATALDALEKEGLDAISLCPLWENESFWENVNVPIYLVGIARLMALRTEDPTCTDAVATGALILVKAEALRRAGGLEAVRGEILDDVALARLLKSRGAWDRTE